MGENSYLAVFSTWFQRSKGWWRVKYARELCLKQCCLAHFFLPCFLFSFIVISVRYDRLVSSYSNPTIQNWESQFPVHPATAQSLAIKLNCSVCGFGQVLLYFWSTQCVLNLTFICISNMSARTIWRTPFLCYKKVSMWRKVTTQASGLSGLWKYQIWNFKKCSKMSPTRKMYFQPHWFWTE